MVHYYNISLSDFSLEDCLNRSSVREVAFLHFDGPPNVLGWEKNVFMGCLQSIQITAKKGNIKRKERKQIKRLLRKEMLKEKKGNKIKYC